jgi:hypothetical protein
MNHHFHPTAVAALPHRILPLPQQPSESRCWPFPKPPAFPPPLWITHMLLSTAARVMSSRRGNYLRCGLFRNLLPAPIRSMPHQMSLRPISYLEGGVGNRAISPQIANGGRDFCLWIFIGSAKAVLWSPPNRQFISLCVVQQQLLF